jgi:hypothetical protein
MKELKIIKESERHILDIILAKAFFAGQFDGLIPVDEFRAELQNLLQQQAALTREETIKECLKVISTYKEDTNGAHKIPHKGNWNMLLYEARIEARQVVCDHILKKIELLTKQQ